MKRYILKYLRKIIGTDKILVTQRKILTNINENQKNILEILNANKFTNSIQDSLWLKNKSFSPGNYAVDYSFLYTLFRILNEIKPNSVVEFGLGQSTKMVSQFCEYYGKKAIVFEHNKEWLEFFNKSFLLSANCEVRLTKLKKLEFRGYETLRYDEDFNKIINDNIELIILDGPFGSKRFSRTQILDLIPACLATDNFCIMIDDYHRSGEIETSKLIKLKLEEDNIEYVYKKYSGQKEHLVICSKNNIFLTSL